MRNPFEMKIPEWFPRWAGPIYAETVEDQMRITRRADPDKLRDIIAWPGTWETVRKAARKRLRRIDA